MSDAGTGRSSIGQTGSPVTRSEDEDEPVLGHLRDRADRPSVDSDIDEVRGGGRIEIPQVVMHELEVPDALAGCRLECDEAGREQVVAGPVHAVEVIRARRDWQVHVTQLRVCAHRCPDVGVPRVLPRPILPRLVSELPWLRNGVERPQQLPGPHVKTPDMSGRLLLVAGLVGHG